jgi:hypothetical protein
MVISQNQVGNHILFGIASTGQTKERALPPISLQPHQKVQILEGSLFEDDCKDHNVHVLLHQVRRAMEEGVILVIIGLEILYESLYDVLNKNYTQVWGFLSFFFFLDFLKFPFLILFSFFPFLLVST